MSKKVIMIEITKNRIQYNTNMDQEVKQDLHGLHPITDIAVKQL